MLLYVKNLHLRIGACLPCSGTQGLPPQAALSPCRADVGSAKTRRVHRPAEAGFSFVEPRPKRATDIKKGACFAVCVRRAGPFFALLNTAEKGAPRSSQNSGSRMRRSSFSENRYLRYGFSAEKYLGSVIGYAAVGDRAAFCLFARVCRVGIYACFAASPDLRGCHPVCRRAGSRAFQRSAVRLRPESGRTVQAQVGRFDIRCAGELEMGLTRNAGTDAYQVVVAVGRMSVCPQTCEAGSLSEGRGRSANTGISSYFGAPSFFAKSMFCTAQR